MTFEDILMEEHPPTREKRMDKRDRYIRRINTEGETVRNQDLRSSYNDSRESTAETDYCIINMISFLLFGIEGFNTNIRTPTIQIFWTTGNTSYWDLAL